MEKKPIAIIQQYQQYRANTKLTAEATLPVGSCLYQISLGDLYVFRVELSFQFHDIPGCTIVSTYMIHIDPHLGTLKYKIKVLLTNGDVIWFSENRRTNKITVYNNTQTINFSFDVEVPPDTKEKSGSYIRAIKDHFKSESVKLISSDGIIEVNKYLLSARSDVLKAMFENDLEEAKTGEVKMEDVNIGTLTAFVNFLSTDRIENIYENACGLFVLADKYNIPLLKAETGAYMAKNMNNMKEDFDTIFNLLVRLEVDLVRETLKENLKMTTHS